MSEANEITAGLLEKIPERFPNLRIWRNNRVKAVVVGKGGRKRMMDAGINGQADISGLIGPTGRRLEIEVKAGDDRLNEDQKNFCRMIRTLGGVYVEARSVEDGLRNLAESMHPVEASGFESAKQIVERYGGADEFIDNAIRRRKERKEKSVGIY